MEVYIKYGARLTNEAARIDDSCYFADKVIKVRAIPENGKREQVYWVKDLLAWRDDRSCGIRQELETTELNYGYLYKAWGKAGQ